MTCHKYDILNCDGTIIKTIKIGSKKNSKTAEQKLVAIFGKNSCFLRLKYAGTWEL